MCLNCYWDKGNGCECTDENMTEEDVEKIEKYEYHSTNCPFFSHVPVKIERNDYDV